MECHLKKSISIIIAASMLSAICYTGQAANTLFPQVEKPTKQHVIASQRRGNLVEQPILTGHYYIISNNSPAGTLREGKFTGLTYSDYGKQHLPKPGVQAASPNNAPNEPFGWQQEYRDADLGFTYLRARYYQPELKSFMSMDSYSLDNKYVYGYANPVGFIDPSGHMPALANYLLNSFALMTGMAMMIPTAGASFAWSATTIAGAISVASGATGVVAQGLSDVDLGGAGTVLEYVSSSLAGIGMVSDIAVGAGKVLGKALAIEDLKAQTLALKSQKNAAVEMNDFGKIRQEKRMKKYKAMDVESRIAEEERHLAAFEQVAGNIANDQVDVFLENVSSRQQKFNKHMDNLAKLNRLNAGNLKTRAALENRYIEIWRKVVN